MRLNYIISSNLIMRFGVLPQEKEEVVQQHIIFFVF